MHGSQARPLARIASDAAGNGGGSAAIRVTCMVPAAGGYLADAARRHGIRDRLVLARWSAITFADMAQLTDLGVPDAGIASVAELQYAVNIGFLSLYDNTAASFSQLEFFELRGNQVSDITFVAGTLA